MLLPLPLDLLSHALDKLSAYHALHHRHPCSNPNFLPGADQRFDIASFCTRHFR